jgi:glutamate synthase (NADPH/NADH)
VSRVPVIGVGFAILTVCISLAIAGADIRDGDGAGGMYAIPHKMLIRETPHCFLPRLPSNGQYATGNVFFSQTQHAEQMKKMETLADSLGLRVLGWREVPTDGSILGPSSKSREPKILQPFVVLKEHYGTGNNSDDGPFDVMHFDRQLFVLRKMCTTAM